MAGQPLPVKILFHRKDRPGGPRDGPEPRLLYGSCSGVSQVR